MYIRIGYEFQFDLSGTTHLVLMLHTHPERAHLLQRPQRLHHRIRVGGSITPQVIEGAPSGIAEASPAILRSVKRLFASLP